MPEPVTPAYIVQRVHSPARYVVAGAEGRLFLCEDVGACSDRPRRTAAYRAAVQQISGLQHPNLSPPVDSFASQGHEYLVFDLHEGMALDAMVTARVPPSRERLVHLVQQLCDVFSFLDEQSPSFVLDAIDPAAIVVSRTGVLHFSSYRLQRCLEWEEPHVFCSEPFERAANYRLLADLVLFLVLRRHVGNAANGLKQVDARLATVLRRMYNFAAQFDTTFQEAKRSLTLALEDRHTPAVCVDVLPTAGGKRRLSATFSYVGFNDKGQKAGGQVEADTLHDAYDRLRHQGVRPDKVRPSTWGDLAGLRLRRVRWMPLVCLLAAAFLCMGLYSVPDHAAAPIVVPHNQVLVACENGSLTAVDMASHACRRMGWLPARPLDLKVLGDGRFLASLAHGRVSILRADSGELVQELPVEHAVDRILSSPDGRSLLAIQSRARTVSVIDTEGLVVRQHMLMADVIGDAVFTHDGRRLYVSLPALNTIAVWDMSAGQLRSFGAAGEPQALSNPVGMDLWYLTDTATLRRTTLDNSHDGAAVDDLGSLHPQAVTLSPDGLTALVRGETGVDVFTQHALTSNLTLRANAWTWDRRAQLWITARDPSTLSIYSPVEHSITATITLPSPPVALDICP